MKASDNWRGRPRHSRRRVSAPQVFAVAAALGLLTIFGYSRLQSADTHSLAAVGDAVEVSSSGPTAAQARTHPTGFFNGWFVSRSIGWTVTTNGMGSAALSRTIDGGVHWTPQLSLVYPHLLQRDMSFLDDNNGFVAIGIPMNGVLSSRLMATSDGGTHWSARSLPGVLVSGIDFVSPTSGWVLTGQAGASSLFRTNDGGTTWRACASLSLPEFGPAALHLEGVRFANAHLGWVAGWVALDSGAARPFYLVTTNACDSWQTTWLTMDQRSSNRTELMYIDLPEAIGSRFAAAVVTREVGTDTYRLFTYSSPTAIKTWTLDRTMDSTRTVPAWAPVGNLRSAAVAGGVVEGLNTAPSVGTSSTVVGIQFVDNASGFAEVAVGPSVRLMSTLDGGATWTLVAEGR